LTVLASSNQGKKKENSTKSKLDQIINSVETLFNYVKTPLQQQQHQQQQ